MLENSLKTLAKIIESALKEDEVFNDLTSDLTIAEGTKCNFAINAREDLVFCGKKECPTSNTTRSLMRANKRS